MGVPVLAYAATAVPSTMDGAGILYTDKDPMHVAGADQRHRRRSARSRDRIVDGQYAALDRLKPRISPGRCCGTSTTCWRRRGASIRRSHSISGIRSIRRRSTTRSRRTGRRRFWRCRRSRDRDPGSGQAMIVNQWVPAAHKGDAIGDSARRVRGAAARDGPPVRSLRDDD